MGKRGRPKKKIALDDLPDTLRFAIIKVMVEHNVQNIDYAYDLCSRLITQNSEELKQKIRREAEKRYRKRFLSEFNKGRATIRKEAMLIGESKGYHRAKEEYGMYYYCCICGELIYMTPNSKLHKNVIEYLRNRRWGHAECHKKNK